MPWWKRPRKISPRSRARSRQALVDDPISETITYDDFAKIDLRVALIKKAEAVPEAEKLLKLQLDIGGETRQVFAGIKVRLQPGRSGEQADRDGGPPGPAQDALACPKAWCAGGRSGVAGSLDPRAPGRCQPGMRVK